MKTTKNTLLGEPRCVGTRPGTFAGHGAYAPRLAKVLRLATLTLLACFLTAVVAFADDPKPDDPPPVIEKKKKVDPPKTKDADPKKDPDKKAPDKKDVDPKKDDPKDEPAPDGADGKKLLERINKNMEESKDRLAKKDPSAATREIQKDIVKDLDALIKQQQQDQNQPMGGGGSSSSSNSKNSKGQTSRSKRPSSRPEKMAGSDTKNKPEPSSGTQAGAGNNSSGDATKLADSFKAIWGHLPETMRLEMDAYAREQFMPKYSELLKQYYSTIAERRREGDK